MKPLAASLLFLALSIVPRLAVAEDNLRLYTVFDGGYFVHPHYYLNDANLSWTWDLSAPGHGPTIVIPPPGQPAPVFLPPLAYAPAYHPVTQTLREVNAQLDWDLARMDTTLALESYQQREQMIRLFEREMEQEDDDDNSSLLRHAAPWELEAAARRLGYRK